MSTNSKKEENGEKKGRKKIIYVNGKSKVTNFKQYFTLES